MDYFASFDPAACTDKITAFIQDTFKNTGKSTAVIAVSGGIDSALSLILASKALSPQNIQAYYLPSKNSAAYHLEDAKSAVAAVGLPEDRFHIINIGAIIQKSWRIIKHYSLNEPQTGFQSERAQGAEQKRKKSFPAPNDARRRTPLAGSEDVDLERETSKLRLANLTARIRMTVIYDQAKKHDALVVGTENFSEHLLGYYTRFGDEASDLEPIRHLYKTEIIKLAEFLNVPPSIITKPPSADLWKGQTDENELGFSYTAADPILYLINQGKTKTDIIAAGFPEPLVSKVLNQVDSSAYKHQVPYHL